MTEKYGYGFKALDPTGATYPNRRDGSKEMLYALPRPGETWGPWIEHPYPAQPDEKACGSGRFHLWKCLSGRYGPKNWWPWYVQYDLASMVGEDYEKLGVTRMRLRRIAPRVLWRAIRLGWGREAHLANLNLYEANLTEANLTWANLSGANLYRANLYGAIGLKRE